MQWFKVEILKLALKAEVNIIYSVMNIHKNWETLHWKLNFDKLEVKSVLYYNLLFLIIQWYNSFLISKRHAIFVCLWMLINNPKSMCVGYFEKKIKIFNLIMLLLSIG